MNLNALYCRFRWLHLPTGFLIMVLQRSPAPVLRALVQLETLVANQSATILRSSVVVAAMGAYNSVAGATVFNVTPATPTSGAANATFTVSGTVGTALSVGISVSGAPGNPKSWSVKSTTPLPAGMSVTGGNPVNVVAPYKMTIAGTPTTSGTTSCTVTAWDGLNGTGGNSAKITVTFAITGGVVATAPAITTQPSSQTITTGGTATFTVAASGSPAPTFQWLKNGANIAGATSATLSLSNVQAADAGSYSAVATNSAGSATSAAATLTVQAAPPVGTAPTITTQPSNQTVTAGATATFTVGASGSPTPTYQWQKNGVNIAGATSATLSLSNVQNTDAGTYAAVATNSVGTATSAGATLTVQAAPPATVAPAITTQPSSQTVTAGGAATFTVAASGNPTPTFQWLKNGVNVAGATSATLALSNVQNSDAGTYTAVATNSAGTTTSAAATLTVQAATTAPTITTQPASQSATVGGSVSFTVAATGNPAPSLQWRKDGVAIAGATSAVYALANLQTSDAGSYTVVATNSAGSATSAAATLTVQAAPPANTAPTISMQPSSQSAVAGGSATFTVSASGNPAPTYQWKKDGANVAGATTATLALSNVQSSDAGSYTVVVTNSAGTVTSSAATLSVQAAAVAPSITTQPTSQVVTAGASVTFTVAATGSPTPTFQWQKNGANIAGATGASYAIATTVVGDTGTYTVLVANSAGSVVSSAVTLTVGAASGGGPAITSTLPAQTVSNGHNISFTGQSLSGSYQWMMSSNGGSTWSPLANNGTYSGVNSQTLTINGAGMAMNGYQYRYVVTDGSGSSTSNAAVLTVATVFFPYPTGIAFLGGGNLYITDSTANTVQKVTTAGDVTLVAGTSGTAGTTNATGAAALFNQPGGLVVTGAGVIFVADTANATLRRIGTDGVVSTFAGSTSARGNTDGTGTAATFSAPQGLALDSAGNLYVADSTNHTIRKITSAGVVSTLAGTAGVTGASDGAGAAARFNYPSGVAVDAAGNVFVADRSNNVIRKITPAGVVTTFVGLAGVSGSDDGTGGGALFNQPTGLVLDGAGNLYVADTGNSTIRKVSSAGVVTTLAGLPTIGGNQDGTGLGAMFNQPRALTIDDAGNLYVVDTGNSAIRKVTPAGVVTTLTLQQGAAAPVTGGSGGGSTGGSSGTNSGTSTASSGPTETGAGALNGAFAGSLGLLLLARSWRRRAQSTVNV